MSDKKKLLLLGGIHYLIPVIEKAKELGLYVITCDYLPDNIAHQYSDEFHNVSITDRDRVLALAKKLNIDGIMSFAVDPGVTTAAYVAENLDLPSSGPMKSIEILQNKSLFRKFLKDHNFNTPKAKGYENIEDAINDIDYYKWPIIVKPVDSAGSKGVSKVTKPGELKSKIETAINFSPSNNFIIEEYIEQAGYSSDSDFFSINGQVIFSSFSNQIFDVNTSNPYTPAAYSWPPDMDIDHQTYLIDEIQRLLSLLKMKSSIYNIETRVGKDGIPYIMEVSPRGGGNRIAEILHMATGVDLIEYAIKVAVNIPLDNYTSNHHYNGYWFSKVLYSNEEGLFKKITVDHRIKKYLQEIELRVKEGDQVKAFSSANYAIGSLIFKFPNKSELNKYIEHIDEYVHINVTQYD